MIKNNSLFTTLIFLTEQFKTSYSYAEYRESFFNSYKKFNEYFLSSDFREKNLVFPLKMHFEYGFELFFSINEPDDFIEKIENYKLITDEIYNFWYYTVIDYRYLTKGPNIFYVTYLYLRKFSSLIDSLYKISITDYLFNNEDGESIIKLIQIFYCTFYSDKNISEKMNDNLYMYIEDLFEKFWEIFYNIDISNRCETTYKLKILSNLSNKRLRNFSKQYPKISKHFNSNEPDEHSENI